MGAQPGCLFSLVEQELGVWAGEGLGEGVHGPVLET